MFGHKSSNQTTVGTAVVQNPSMLDNVSTDDFATANDEDSAASDVQQQVQEALNTKDIQSVLDSAPQTSSLSGTFMSSPSAAPTAVIASTQDPAVPVVPSTDDDSGKTSAPEVMGDAADTEAQPSLESNIPHPLSAEENKEIESHPAVVSVSSPVMNDDNDNDTSASQSASAPIEPPVFPATEKESVPVLDTTNIADNTESETLDPVSDTGADTSVSENLPVEQSSKSDEETTTDAPNAVASPDESSSSPTSSVTDVSSEIDTEKLAGMKQQALEHLEPLVDHLDQTPEEEFRTTMMRIQANDNHTLLERALEAAKKISDDKERAQAMLDIVNEINYFSQSPKTD